MVDLVNESEDEGACDRDAVAERKGVRVGESVAVIVSDGDRVIVEVLDQVKDRVEEFVIVIVAEFESLWDNEMLGVGVNVRDAVGVAEEVGDRVVDNVREVERDDVMVAEKLLEFEIVELRSVEAEPRELLLDFDRERDDVKLDDNDPDPVGEGEPDFDCELGRLML